MRKTKLTNLILILLSCMLAVASCKKSSDSDSSSNTPTETALIKEGQIVNSDFYVNDVLREEMIDTVVNLGSKELPALFYLNGKHTLDGAPVLQGNHHSNVFRSLSRGHHLAFIVLWGKIIGMDIDINDTSASSIKKRQLAFYELAAFLMRSDIDFPLLVALSTDSTELKCAKKWVDAASDISASGTKLAEPNTPDNIFRALEISGLKISALSSAAQTAGMTEKDFLLMAQNKGIDLAHTLIQVKAPDQLIVVVLVALGVKMFFSWTLRFITHGNPNPNLNDQYASFLNDADSNVMNYFGAKDTVSPTYKVAYCTLATAEFYIETYYNAHHGTLAGQYVNRVGMIVKSVHCSWGMHVDGNTVFDVGQYSGPPDNPVAISAATVTVKYGDCCCFKRTGTLKFNISGDKGYEQTSWKPGN